MGLLKTLKGRLNMGMANNGQPLAGEGDIKDIYGRPVKDALEYFYSKKIKGIPVFSVESICHHYKDKIREIKNRSGIGDHRMVKTDSQELVLLDELFTRVIERYIEYIHMLPASESHHHASPGGMIVHSLESSIYAQRYTQEHRPDSIGMLDLDKSALPVYQYAAWLGAFMHDAGKVLRDIVVDAVEVYKGGQNVPASNAEPAPSWRPQKETLLSWAERYSVATYSVTYVRDRIHNQHNVDSVQLLTPVLGGGVALDYLLDSPVDVHGQLVHVLAGYDNGKDYIATAARRGDMLSTSRNAAQTSSTFLTEKTMSASGKIYKAMQSSRRSWMYNEINGHAWVIGNDVYLRHKKTFHTIINEARKMDLVIPTDIRTVMTIMEDNGIIEQFDKDSKSIRFTPGVFTDKEILDIKEGKKTVQWEELVKVKWRGLVFGEDPVPDASPGLVLTSSDDTLVEVNEMGKFRVITDAVAKQVVRDNKKLPDIGNTGHGETTPPPDGNPAMENNQPESGEDRKASQSQKNKVKVPDEMSVTDESPGEKQESETSSGKDKKLSPKEEKIKSLRDESKKKLKKAFEMDFVNKPKPVKSETDEKPKASPKQTSEKVKAKPKRSKSQTGDKAGTVASVTDTQLPDVTDKAIIINGKPGQYIQVSLLVALSGEKDNRQATKWAQSKGMLFVEGDKPSLVAYRIDGKSELVARLAETNSPVKGKLEEKISSGTDKPSSPEMRKDTSAKKGASAQDKEDRVDYGLMMRLSKATSGRLSFTLNSIIKSMGDDADYGELIEEREQLVAINAMMLVERLNELDGVSLKLRDISKAMRESSVSFERVEREGVTFIEVDASQIDEVELKV